MEVLTRATIGYYCTFFWQKLTDGRWSPQLRKYTRYDMCGTYSVRAAQCFSLAPAGTHGSWDCSSGYHYASLATLCSWVTYSSNSMELLSVSKCRCYIPLHQVCNTSLLQRAFWRRLLPASRLHSGLPGIGWTHRLWKLVHQRCARGVTAQIGGHADCFRVFPECHGWV